jgi:hypothetical protein
MVKVSKGNTISFSSPTDIVLCDPCYIFDYKILDKEWQEIVKQMYSSEKILANTGIIEFAGAKILYTSTKHGDGTYPVHCDINIIGNTAIGVDAGLICICSLEDTLKVNPDFNAEDMGAVIKGYTGTVTTQDFNIEGDKGLLIDTHMEEEDWEENNWEEDEEDEVDDENSNENNLMRFTKFVKLNESFNNRLNKKD